MGYHSERISLVIYSQGPYAELVQGMYKCISGQPSRLGGWPVPVGPTPVGLTELAAFA